MLTVELSRILDKIPGKIITRFAPAPTGALHAGHILSAMFVWGIGRLSGAEILLRIEDHDRERSRREYETGILEDLMWLGFIQGADVVKKGTPFMHGAENSDHSGHNPVSLEIASIRKSELFIRQSERNHFYDNILFRLRQDYNVYFCNCSRNDLQKRNPGVPGEIPYDGFCAGKNITEDDASSIRLELSHENIEFYDAVFGLQNHIPKNQCGDLLIRDRKGNWTYQFCAAADDMDQGVNFVIRGEDLFDSSARQVQLGRMLGRKNDIVFLHHPLIYNAGGQKLAKSIGSDGIADLREKGREPGDIMGKIAREAGLIAEKRYLYADEIEKIFEPFVR